MNSNPNSLSSRPLLLLGSAIVAAGYGAVSLLDSAPPIERPPWILDDDEQVVAEDVAAATGRVRGAETDLYCAPIGRRMTFEIDAKTATTLRSDRSSRGADAAIHFEGTLTLEVVGRREGELLVEARFPSLTGRAHVAQSERDAASLLEPMVAPTLTRWRDDGRLLGLRFDRSATRDARNMIRNVLSGLQVVLGEPGEDEWSVEEEDCAGIYIAEYVRTGESEDSLELGKSKCRYHSDDPRDAVRAVNEHAPQEVRSNGSLTFDLAVGWPSHVEFNESTRTRIEQIGGALESSFALRASLESHEDLQRARARSDWGGAWQRVTGEGGDAEAMDRDAIAELDHEAVMERLAGAMLDPNRAIEAGKLRRQLVLWFRYNPERLDSLRGEILTMGESTATLLSMLGESGTDEAELFLADVVGDRSLDDGTRWAGLVGMASRERPGAAAVVAAREAYRDGGNPGMLRRSGLLLLGVFGSRRGEAAVTEEILATEQDFAPADRGVWLEALGNTADPAIVPKVTEYATADDVEVRRAAVSALREVDTDEARELLFTRGLEDDSARVRATAIELLGARPDGAGIIRYRLASERDPAVHLAAVRGLSLRPGDDAGAIGLLGELAEGSPFERVRSAARAGLSPTHAM